MKKISAERTFFIKLGKKGEWERLCIKEGQTIRLGFNKVNHKNCLHQRWDKVKKDLRKTKAKGKATEFINQIKKFYETNEKTLWITFCDHRMWWAFAKAGVERLSDGSKIRKVIGRWRSTDVDNKPLTLDRLSGKLTKTQGFRGAICRVREEEYVKRKINGERPPEVEAALKAKQSLERELTRLIQGLGPKDFELFAQLIFTSAGWQRVGVLGKTQKDIDLDLRSPITGERMMVQVKSSSDRKEFEKYCGDFCKSKDFASLWYVVHSPSKSLEGLKPRKRVRLILAEQLAELAIDAGHARWLIEKSS